VTWSLINRRLGAWAAAAVLAATLAGTARAATRIDASVMVQPVARESRLDVDVWINKDEGGVYRQGEAMRVFFRANADAFVLIYNIDTEGYIHLVYPYGPDDPDRVEGGVTYQVPSRHDPYDLVADGPTGIEYVVAIASPEPFRDLPWYLRGRYDEGDQDQDQYDGDDEDSGVIVGDPYVGMDRVIRRIVPQGLEDEVSTDDTFFYIERKVDYPRYVCADCHSYGSWYDPYVDVCTVVDVRIDAAWARYRPWPLRAPIVARPRYYYMVRSTAPTRYRQWKDRWSSADGRTTLRTRFQTDGNDKFTTRRREILQQRTPPEFQNFRQQRSGRVWRSPDEVLRRYRDDASRYRDSRSGGSWYQRQRDMQNQHGRDQGGGAPQGDTRQRDDRPRDDSQQQRDWRQRNDDRRREWLERNEQRRNEQRQEQQREEQQRQRNDDQRQRQMREQRDDQRHDDSRDRGNHESKPEQRDRGDRGHGNDRDRHDKPDRGDGGWGNRRGR
jgi:hypothetical protein